MTRDAIRAFKGELLWAPEALELSMSWCSHACAYCYANARKPDRRVDLPAIMNLLGNFHRRTTREARLLQLGYPVNVSNHVDVFAGSNASQFEPIWELMVAQKIPIVFQTRGAHKPQQKILDRVIAETPPSVWYVSVPMWDEAIRRRIEPHAPSIPYRMELIEQLRAAGHEVVVGVNPVTLEWLPVFEPLLDRCRALGVWGLWFSSLYFGRTFGESLTPKQVEMIGPELIKHCGCKGAAVDHHHILQIMDYAESIGLATYYHRSDRPSRLFEVWNRMYPKVMPMIQELINAADEDFHATPDLPYLVIDKAAAVSCMQPLPEGFNYGVFFHHDVKQLRIEYGLPQGAPLPRFDVDGFWDLLWRSTYFSKQSGPLTISRFALASVKSKGEITPLLDDNDDPILVYRPQGWKHLYASTPELD
jgi:hypothetical protein